MARKFLPLWIGALAAAALVACGGGGGSADTSADASQPQGMGTLRLSLTDNPGCEYDEVWVTVEKLRVHRSSDADDGDGGWVDVPFPYPQPRKVDLLTLTNGVLMPLGEVGLPAGKYTQLRMVLAQNPGTAPWANEAKPKGGAPMVELTTPSAQQSGLKMNVDITVPPGQVANVAIDIDACKSIRVHSAGKSGKTILSPVVRVIPILSADGQRIEGWLDPTLAGPGTNVSAQVNGEVVRATPPLADGSGKFVLYPVPAGTYDLVITAAGRVNAVITGVPVDVAAKTTIGAATSRVNTPASAASQAAGGTITVNSSVAETGGVVRAMQSLTNGPTIEVGSANARSDTGVYGFTLSRDMPVQVPFAAGAVTFPFFGTAADAAKYRLLATATGFDTPKQADISLGDVPTVQNFDFP
jgi:Domain of unknown function (DUF4382)